MKSQIYKNNLQSILQLQDELTHVTSKIETQLCQSVIEKFNKRGGVAIGGYLSDVAFHT